MMARLGHQSLANEPLLSLLLQLTQRPSSHCLRRNPSSRSSSRILTYAKAQRCFSTTPIIYEQVVTSKQAKKTYEASTSTIPIHVGLDRNPRSLSAISRIPIPNGERGEVFTPSVLSHPLGLPYAPQAGQNTPVDNRPITERAQEFSNKEKALQRRKILLRTYFRPYFQEWRRVEHWRGKSFVASERLFRKDAALYFPNMWGSTLSEEGDGPDAGRDTTPALRGKITVVGVQSSAWAEEQVNTFLSAKENPEFAKLVEARKVQRADINVQDNWLRALLVFTSVLRKQTPKEQWERYFRVRMARDVRRGLTEDIRDAMGFLNSQVGYVYLLDSDCKIRWAGSGHAWPGEKESLNAGIRRLHAEMTGEKVKKEDAMPPKIEMPKGVMGSPRVQRKQKKIAMAA